LDKFFFILKTEKACFYETSVHVYQTAWRFIPEDSNLYIHTVATLNLEHTTRRTAHTNHYAHWASQAYINGKVFTLSTTPLRRIDSGGIDSSIIHLNSRGRYQFHNPVALSRQKWHQHPVHKRSNGLRAFQNAMEKRRNYISVSNRTQPPKMLIPQPWH